MQFVRTAFAVVKLLNSHSFLLRKALKEVFNCVLLITANSRAVEKLQLRSLFLVSALIGFIS